MNPGNKTRFRHVTIHIPALLMYTALAIWSAFPLAWQIDAAIPGIGAGDNVSYLWNAWWFQYAWDHKLSYFHTPMLFAPFGTQLVLHTHTMLQSAMTASLLRFASIVAAHNIVIIAGLAANGLSMYALAFYSVRRVLPSLAAGLSFAGCAYVQSHLLGHFNLTHVWVVPLFAFALLRLLSQPSYIRAILVAVASAAVTYTDYYLTVYCALFTVLWCTGAAFDVAVTARPRRYSSLGALLAVLVAADVLLIVVIASTGGTAFALGSHHVSMRGIRNPLSALWVLLAAWAFCMRPIGISIRRRPEWRATPAAWRAAALAVGAYAVLMSPIIVGAAEVFSSGDYVTQRVLWRSGPPGVDVATVLLGHPRHLVVGRATQSIYDALGIGLEQIAWAGLAPLLLLTRSIRGTDHDAAFRIWLAIGAVFFVWSLGPFLRVCGIDTALPLPWSIARYAPVLSNARLPGRAFIMVQLAIGMLLAIALARETNRNIVWAVAALLVLESIPAPVPVYTLPRRDAVDAYLAAQTGSVVELPTGLRDGFGETGRFDHRALVHQMMHGRPLVGGFVARLSPRVRDGYAQSPFLRRLLALSENTAPPDAQAAPDAASGAAIGVRYLVLNRDSVLSERALSRQSLADAGYEFIVSDAGRELYRVRTDRSPPVTGGESPAR